MEMTNKVTDSMSLVDLYASPNPVKASNKFLRDDKFIKIQNIDNTSYLTKQIFHAVQHGYLNFLQIVPKQMWKNCLNILDEKNSFSLLHYAVWEHQKDVISYLLRLKPDINIVASKLVRPIHLAAQKGNEDIVELLCSQKNLQIDVGDDKGQTPLHIACRRGHHSVVKILLKHGASVNKLEFDKISMMHHPVRRNDLDMIKTLLIYNAPINIKNNNGQTPIMIAAIEGHFELLNFLLRISKERGYKISNILNDKDNDGFSCISFGVQNKNLEIIKICLQHHADINSQQVDGKTIFHTAAIIGYTTLYEIIEYDNINLNGSDQDLNTPLHLAVINNSVEMVELLIKYEANINICNRQFQTPILLACVEMSQTKDLTDIIKILILAKADLRIKDSNMKTIIHHLVMKQNLDMIKYIITNMPEELRMELVNSQDNSFNSPLHYSATIGNIQMCQTLLDAGADPKLFSENDCLALHAATNKGYLDVVKLLLEASAETGYYRDSNESSAIHLAAEQGKFEIFKFLVENGKDCLAKDEFGRNTLMFASRSGSLSIVQFLLNNEINVNLHDQMKITALHQAAGEGHLEIVKCLWKYGARLTDNMFGQSPFDVAIINKKDDVARFFLNDDNWKIVMAFRHKNGHSHIDNLIKCNDDITMELMDKCIIENTTNKMDPNYEIKYWFGLLDAGPDDYDSISERYYALTSMAKYKKLDLLNHPLSQNLLKQKWKTFGFGFYLFDLIIYLMFLILITYYMIANTPMTDDDLFDIKTGCKQMMSNQSVSKGTAGTRIVLTNTIIYGITGARFMLKLVKLIGQKFRFFLDSWNYLFTICDVFVLVFINDPRTLPCLYQWQFAPALILISYYLILYYFQHIRIIGIKVMMFLKVLQTILKVLMTFGCLFVGFGYGFYIINSNQGAFSNQGVAMIKSTGMMIGELELVTYFVTGKNNYLVISLIMITLFMIIMPITLFNLIIGLAVGDIDEMASEAELAVLSLRVDYAWEVESRLPIQVQRHFYKTDVYIHPNKKKKSRKPAFLKMLL